MLPTKTDWQGYFIFCNTVHQTQQHSKHAILLSGVMCWQCWQRFQSVRPDRKKSLKNFPRELNSRLAWHGLGHSKSAYRTRSIAPASGFRLGKFFPLQMQASFTNVSYHFLVKIVACELLSTLLLRCCERLSQIYSKELQPTNPSLWFTRHPTPVLYSKGQTWRYFTGNVCKRYFSAALYNCTGFISVCLLLYRQKNLCSSSHNFESSCGSHQYFTREKHIIPRQSYINSLWSNHTLAYAASEALHSSINLNLLFSIWKVDLVGQNPLILVINSACMRST
jgi:hypothetical protein